MARLLRAEEALAPTCTCMACMGTLEKPILLSPCGHSVCEKCFQKARGLCAECPDGNGHVQAAIPNAPLEVNLLLSPMHLNPHRSFVWFLRSSSIDILVAYDFHHYYLCKYSSVYSFPVGNLQQVRD
jgi:hypothetical protein